MHTFSLRRIAAAALLAAASIGASAATGTDIYQFQDLKGNNAGMKPVGALVADKTGHLYGNTQYGGPASAGTAYEMTPTGDGTWTHTVLWTYSTQTPAGAWPTTGLVPGPDGALYGTTTLGSTGGFGSVFRLYKTATGAWKTQVLHAFDFAADGSAPAGPLAFDAAGNLWGTLSTGGPGGQGSVFRLSRQDGKLAWQIMWQFAGAPTDGATPVGSLAIGADGKVYGATQGGGAFGLGTVWRLAAGKKGTTMDVLFDFRGDNGMMPLGGVAMDAKGTLYGTASGGASTGGGVAFSLTPDGTAFDYAVLHAFAGGSEGWAPGAPLTLGAKGQVFGTTQFGGSGSSTGGGTVFQLARSKDGSWGFSTLFGAASVLDSMPYGVTPAADGKSLFTSQTLGDGVIGLGGYKGNLLQVTP